MLSFPLRIPGKRKHLLFSGLPPYYKPPFYFSIPFYLHITKIAGVFAGNDRKPVDLFPRHLMNWSIYQYANELIALKIQ